MDARGYGWTGVLTGRSWRCGVFPESHSLPHPWICEPFLADVLGITDDDGPSLALTLSAAAAPEGRNPALTGSLSRNTPPNASLVVLLESSNVGEARVPASVTIPAGTNRVSFPVQTIEDGVTDGNQTVSLSASAPGYSPSSASLVVTDLNLPDLVVSRLTVPATGIAGSVVPVSFRVENRGFAPVANGFYQSVSLADSRCSGAVRWPRSSPGRRSFPREDSWTRPPTSGSPQNPEASGS